LHVVAYGSLLVPAFLVVGFGGGPGGHVGVALAAGSVVVCADVMNPP
jgi:hypothetical protein